jgi:hypothetical protein
LFANILSITISLIKRECLALPEMEDIMVRCFLTGVEMNLEDAFLLDLSAVKHVLRDLKQKSLILERLVDQLGPPDRVEAPNLKGGKPKHRKDRRLVSETMASVLSAACPERNIFICWSDWRSRRRSPVQMAKEFQKTRKSEACVAIDGNQTES